MTQKEVDAIILEIFNICMSKGLGFHLSQTKFIDVCDFVSHEYNLNLRFCIDVNSSLFGFTKLGAVTIQDALEQVKQYKK